MRPTTKADGTQSTDRHDDRARTRLRPDDVVAAAARLADDQGLDAVSLVAVAHELGVTQPALYRHVAGVDDLVRRIALLARHELLAALRNAAVGRSGVDAVSAVAAAWRDYVIQHPGRYAATDRSQLHGDEENEAVVNEIVATLAQVVAGFGVTGDQTRLGAWALRSALHGFATLEVERGNPQDIDLDAAFDHLVQLFGTGFQRRERPRVSGRPRRDRPNWAR